MVVEYNYHRYYDSQIGRYITSDPIGLEGGLNVYGYVGGNSLKYTDLLGLLVNATLNTSANTLVVTDMDTGESVTVSAFTGGEVDDNGAIVSPGIGPQIPAPKGDYLITDNPHYRSKYPDWFGLLKVDERIDDYFYENSRLRGGFRLHGGETSHGCVTVNTHNGRGQWHQVFKLINSTKTGTSSYYEGPYAWNPEGAITLYGFLRII